MTTDILSTKPMRALVDSKWDQTAIQVGSRLGATLHTLSPAPLALALSQQGQQTM